MKKIKAIFLSLFLILGMSRAWIHAEEIDPAKIGSLVFTVHDPQGNPVGGGTLTVTKIASIAFGENNNPYFELLPEFEGSHANLEDISNPEKLTRQYNANLIDYLEDYAKKKDLLGQKLTVPSDGIVDFSVLEGQPITQGLYLVVQEDAHPGYKLMPAFLISIPQAVYEGDTFDHYEYNVNASPKSDPEKITNPPTTPDNPDTPPDTPNNPPTNPNLPGLPGTSTTPPTQTPPNRTTTITTTITSEQGKPSGLSIPNTATKTEVWRYLVCLIISGLLFFLILIQRSRSRKHGQAE